MFGVYTRYFNSQVESTLGFALISWAFEWLWWKSLWKICGYLVDGIQSFKWRLDFSWLVHCGNKNGAEVDAVEKIFRTAEEKIQSRLYITFVNEKGCRNGSPDPKALESRLCRRCQFSSSLGINADELTLSALVFKLDHAFDQRKQRVVLAATNILSGLPFCSTLSGENISAKYVLTAKLL
jgi:hypothetical protein